MSYGYVPTSIIFWPPLFPVPRDVSQAHESLGQTVLYITTNVGFLSKLGTLPV